MRKKAGWMAVLVPAIMWGLLPPVPSGADAAPAREAGGSLVDVGSFPIITDGLDEGGASGSHWLVLNKRRRRVYLFQRDGASTAVQSYDLDTLQPIRRAFFDGVALSGGVNATWFTGASGEVIHAIDEEHGRIYFALRDVKELAALTEFPKDAGLGGVPERGGSDGQIAVSRFVMLDEERFDAGSPQFAVSFKSPTVSDHSMWLKSMIALPNEKLALVFTTPHTNLTAIVPVVGHELTVWDVSGLEPVDDARAELTTRTAGAAAVSIQAITECANASMALGFSGGDAMYQWGLLARPEGIWLACHGRNGAGKVVLVPLGPDGRPPAGATQQSFQLSRVVSDVLVDSGGDRLLLKSTGVRGITWWVFDVATRRFTGSVAATLYRISATAGLDPATGRLYMQFPDYINYNAARRTPIQGGIYSDDTRLDPVPALENRRADFNSRGVIKRIVVDSPTRRLFVYQAGILGPGGKQPSYRVLRDDRPITRQPPEGDDRRFTVNTAEAEGVTKASYLGSASGYGARALLVGGIAAATERDLAAHSGSACTASDREVAAGHVEGVTLSDVSAAGTAAGLAGDPATEQESGEPVERCWPEAFGDRPTSGGETIDTEAVAFDQDKPADGSDFRVQCVGDDDPDDVGRDGFTADVDCGQSDESVRGEATGGVGLPGVTVGYSNAGVSVKRAEGGGLVAEVDSIARDVVIANVGRIGVVRTVARSAAAGRDGTAHASFERTICGVDLTAIHATEAGCLSPQEQSSMVTAFNRAFSGQGEMKLRQPDPKLAAGSRSGYSAAVQRNRLDLFGDRVITRDNSLAVPGLEIAFFRGDDRERGAGRQILQLAGAQAGTSYGIACLYGQSQAGGCLKAGEEGPPPPDPAPPTVDEDGFLVAGPTEADEGSIGTASAAEPGERGGGGGGRRGLLGRLLRFPSRLATDVLRLLFSSPRELALMAAVWALLYTPFYLAHRRRTVRAVGTRRLAEGVAG